MSQFNIVKPQKKLPSSSLMGGNGSSFRPSESAEFMERSVSPGHPKQEPYLLKSLIVHHGAGIGAGHFTSYRRYNNHWISISDESVSYVRPEVVFNSQAYMIFYERMDQGRNKL
jgi:uncharacterized UBP type Zn finger protein